MVGADARGERQLELGRPGDALGRQIGRPEGLGDHDLGIMELAVEDRVPAFLVGGHDQRVAALLKEAAQPQGARHAAQQLARLEVDRLWRGCGLAAGIGVDLGDPVARIGGRVAGQRIIVEHAQNLGHVPLPEWLSSRGEFALTSCRANKTMNGPIGTLYRRVLPPGRRDAGNRVSARGRAARAPPAAAGRGRRRRARPCARRRARPAAAPRSRRALHDQPEGRGQHGRPVAEAQAGPERDQRVGLEMRPHLRPGAVERHVEDAAILHVLGQEAERQGGGLGPTRRPAGARAARRSASAARSARDRAAGCARGRAARCRDRSGPHRA